MAVPHDQDVVVVILAHGVAAGSMAVMALQSVEALIVSEGFPPGLWESAAEQAVIPSAKQLWP